MVRRINMPSTLPLFPLPGAVLMPRSRMPLQIFEPRYMQMVEDAIRTESRLIGMIQPQIGGLDELAAIGSAGRIVSFTELEGGRYTITLAAVSRFRLTAVQPGFTSYLQAEVDWRGFSRDARNVAEEDPAFNREPFLDRLMRYVDQYDLSTDWDAARNVDSEMLINSLSMLLPFEIEEKQALLEAKTLKERREMLEGLIEYALRTGDNQEIIQ